MTPAYNGYEIATRNAGMQPCSRLTDFAHFNDLGEVAFFCNDTLYYWSGGEFVRIVGEDEVWESEPGVFETIRTVRVPNDLGTQGNRRPTSGFGNQGLVFRLDFQDFRRAAYYVGDPMMVPEPAAAWLQASALLALWALARPRVGRDPDAATPQQLTAGSAGFRAARRSGRDRLPAGNGTATGLPPA